MSLLQLYFSNPVVLWYWPPYLTEQLPRHLLLDQTAPLRKFPKEVIYWRNVFPFRQLLVVSSSAVCVGSSLLVIFISFPGVLQNASEIISSLYEVLSVVPEGDVLSNQNEALFIQFLPSWLEKRATSVQPAGWSQWTCYKIYRLNSNIIYK